MVAQEKRPVWAHAASDQPWLRIDGIDLDGRTGTVRLGVPSVPDRPGETLTRHVVAVGQMLTGALLIHLTGGRIETHFHVFGSLAFLAFYLDWRVLVTASAVARHGTRCPAAART